MKFLLPVLLAVPLLGGVAYAHGTSGPASPQSKQSALDQEKMAFLSRVAEANLAEIKLSRLALARTRTQQVKDFAQRMIYDQTSCYEELRRIAEREGLPFPTEEAGNQKLVYERLAKRSGAEFDRGYLEESAFGQDLVVSLLRNQRGTSDSAIAEFVDRTLPLLQKNSRQAHREVHRM